MDMQNISVLFSGACADRYTLMVSVMRGLPQPVRTAETYLDFLSIALRYGFDPQTRYATPFILRRDTDTLCCKFVYAFDFIHFW